VVGNGPSGMTRIEPKISCRLWPSITARSCGNLAYRFARVGTDLPDEASSDFSAQKKNRFTATPNQRLSLHRPTPQRGGSRSSRTRGGMRWTRQRRRAIGVAGRALNRACERIAGAQTNDADADGEVVWSRRRRQVMRRFCRPDRVQTKPYPRDDGDKKARSPGRARSKP